MRHLLYTLFLLFGLGTGISFAQIDMNKPLTNFRLEADNDLYLTDDPEHVINMVAHFKALTNVNEEHQRYPLNLSIVLDRSGSMSGVKLERTKEAVIHLIKQLRPDDIVSVVTYETEVEVVLKPQKISDRSDVIKKIEKIQSDGSTFLSGGMEKGLNLLQTVKDTMTNDNYVHRMILLSDGLANEGIVDNQALAAIAKKQSTQHNISISTIGVGGDYNETLMTNLAVQGNGNYYFVSKADDIPDIFRKELEGMKTVLAKKTVLKLHFPEDAVSLRQVYFYNYRLENNTVEIQLNDVFSDDQKAFIMEFDVVDGYQGDIQFSAELEYKNTFNNLVPVKEELEFALSPSTSKADYDKSKRQFGSLAKAFMISTSKFEMATVAADEGKYKEAESLIETAEKAIDDYTAEFGKHMFLEDIQDGIKQYKKELKDMQKKPRRNSNLFSRGKRHTVYGWKCRAKF